MPNEYTRNNQATYPAGLLEWAGHRQGGVRKAFFDGVGRPSGGLIETPLLSRLRAWAVSVAAGQPDTPRIVLLVGGPGNGKTEAVEEAIKELETSLAMDGEIRAILAPHFNPTDGRTVPRTVAVDLGKLGCSRPIRLTLVQDASVGESGPPPRNASTCLVSDLERASTAGRQDFYLACVNRGILDDALIVATAAASRVEPLLKSIVSAVSAGVGAPSCWPLHGHRDVAIWPMDVESLFLVPQDKSFTASPAAQALNIAIDGTKWPEFGNCPASERCPYCRSRHLLTNEQHHASFLRILRLYELASGKRWSFRDLLSLLSYTLAGTSAETVDAGRTPCDWAAHLIEREGRAASHYDTLSLIAPFLLVAAQYQHALFGQWPKLGRAGLRREMRELGVDDDPALRGLSAFLAGSQRLSVPRTLHMELVALNDALDPANLSPDLEISVSGRTDLPLRELDSRFSHSVREGFEFIRKYQFLSPNEAELLKKLSDSDDRLSSPSARNRKPSTAAVLQSVVRDFCCRLVRRTLGVRNGIVRENATLDFFGKLIGDDQNLLYQAAKQVESLLNEDGKFTVCLNNTFGEPPPPETRRVVLETNRQKVRPGKPEGDGRPRSDLRWLTIGSHTTTQAVPLTYDLFRAVVDLQGGMMAASLPRTVMASVDAARARLGGRVVRDLDSLDGAEMRIGIRRERIGIELGEFRIREEHG